MAMGGTWSEAASWPLERMMSDGGPKERETAEVALRCRAKWLEFEFG
jgi:hypothetical protein